MHNFKARLSKLKSKYPDNPTKEQEAALRDVISYLDSLAERKAGGDVTVQAEIELANSIFTRTTNFVI